MDVPEHAVALRVPTILTTARPERPNFRFGMRLRGCTSLLPAPPSLIADALNEVDERPRLSCSWPRLLKRMTRPPWLVFSSFTLNRLRADVFSVLRVLTSRRWHDHVSASRRRLPCGHDLVSALFVAPIGPVVRHASPLLLTVAGLDRLFAAGLERPDALLATLAAWAAFPFAAALALAFVFARTGAAAAPAPREGASSAGAVPGPMTKARIPVRCSCRIVSRRATSRRSRRRSGF